MEQTEITRAHVFIFGEVQGRGFRRFVEREAKKRGVSGWVKNLDDGRVEAVFQGRQSSIDDLIMMCDRGPALARVKGVEVLKNEALEILEGFVIRH